MRAATITFKVAGGGYYSRAVTIRGRRLIKEIQYGICKGHVLTNLVFVIPNFAF